MLSGKVLITGGAGFLARGIYRAAERESWDAEFTCLSRDDAKHAALQTRYPDVRTIRWDVAGDLDYLVAAFAGHDTVIHAAAAKYVDRSEGEAWDTARVNVHGSQQVAMAAARAGVHQCIAISTDKAVEAVNVYGMSKAVMERLFLEADAWHTDTRYSVVRYGNVIASTGSVIAKFRDLARRGDTLMLTDPEHTRYWMSVDEAVDVILAGLKAPGLLTIYEPRAMRMGDLAAAIQPDRKAIVIGERPGEKRHETILGEQESSRVIASQGATLVGANIGPVYRIASPASAGTGKRFTLSSNNQHNRLTAAELVRLAEDAEDV